MDFTFTMQHRHYIKQLIIKQIVDEYNKTLDDHHAQLMMVYNNNPNESNKLKCTTPEELSARKISADLISVRVNWKGMFSRSDIGAGRLDNKPEMTHVIPFIWKRKISRNNNYNEFGYYYLSIISYVREARLNSLLQ